MTQTKTFADWLNLIDAIIGYDKRRERNLANWQCFYALGYSGFDAVQALFTSDELAS